MMLPTSLAARSGARKASLRNSGNPRRTGDPTGPRTKLIREVAYAASGLVMIAFCSNALGEIAQSPLFMEQTLPPPNIMLIFDNSKNMLQESITLDRIEAEYTSEQYWFEKLGWDCYSGDNYNCATAPSKMDPGFYSSDWNQLYYNPAITYTPAMTSTGQFMPNADPGFAFKDAYDRNSVRFNLTTICRSKTELRPLPLYDPATFYPNNQCNPGSSGPWLTSQYAFSYKWNDPVLKPSGLPNDQKYYLRRDIMPTRTAYPHAPTRTDCSSQNYCSYKEEIQNFANWFSYHRTRGLAMKTMLSKVFSKFDDRIRVGLFTSNDDASNFVQIDNFARTHRALWFQKLSNIRFPNSKTSLAYALYSTGLYYRTLDNYIKHDPIQAKCQANHAIIASTGYGNYKLGMGDFDYDDYVPDDFPVDKLYDPIANQNFRQNYSFPPPYRRNKIRLPYNETTLTISSAAMMNWRLDIGARKGNGGTIGQFKPYRNDPATWQHLVTHTIRAGGNGENLITAWPLLVRGEREWPVPKYDKPSSIDDLWHAAVNGHGRYIMMPDPLSLEPRLTELIQSIDRVDEKTGAGSSIAYAGTTEGATGFSYAAGFQSSKWTGYLKAYNAKNAVQWDAGELLSRRRINWNTRNIVTWDADSGGKDFLWGKLNAFQSKHLQSPAVLEYLRGNFLGEQPWDGDHYDYGNDGMFRYREIVLGDIVNSTPLYVGRTDFGYASSPDKFGGARYVNFLDTKGKRNHMLYVGANDGMLHGFDAKTGVEKFAFVPNSLFPYLKELSEPNYKHRYFVDGQMTEGDAYLDNKWRNILLGSTGAGSQGVFAIDVTDPARLNAKSILWELDASGDFSDLGNVLGTLGLVRLTNGSWAAIFGNGYNSSEGKAILYIVDINSGRLIKKLDTVIGSKKDPNGLSTPGLIFNSQRELIAAYAGDLRGNLWKFDMAAPDPGNWKIRRIFTATTATGTIAPIVQQPLLTPYPAGGFIINFGTGKYYETADRFDIDRQALYGIWDKPGSSISQNRRNLQQQTLIPVVQNGVTVGRTLTNNPIDWITKSGWYVDMPDSGERFVGRLSVFNNTVLLSTTLTPNPNPNKDLCTVDNSKSFTMATDVLTGSIAKDFVFVGKDGKPIQDANGQNVSAIPTNGTASNGVSIPGPAGDCLTINEVDGTITCIPYQTKAEVMRSWRQLPVE